METGKPDFSQVAEAWDKWEEWLEPCYQSFNNMLLEKARIHSGQTVLDLGCGSGYPALLEARCVGDHGKVFGLDIAENMITVARRRAAKLGLTNVHFQSHDIDTIPFPENYFEAATARFSLMFVDSPSKTLSEVFRVLKNGSTFCAAVWGDQALNPLPRTIIEKYFEIPPTDPEHPGPFRFSSPGTLSSLMKTAGFVDVKEQEFPIKEVYKSGKHYLEHILEASAMWGSLLRKLDSDRFSEASDALVRAAENFRAGSEVQVPRHALIIAATKTS
jgi:enediyne biosynthesis protein CalE5